MVALRGQTDSNLRKHQQIKKMLQKYKTKGYKKKVTKTEAFVETRWLDESDLEVKIYQ